MSSVVQTQMITQVTTTIANTVVTTVDIPRPMTTPAEVAYAEGTDHVTRPIFIREEEGGHVVIDLPAAFKTSAIYLRRMSIRKLLPTAQKGLVGASGALMPTGAPTDDTFVRDVFNSNGANTLATNDTNALNDLLGNPIVGAAGTAPLTYVRSFPGITLRSGEYVRMEFYTAGGAVGPGTINAVYKMGLNQQDTGKP